jgi:hypothetical protein
MGSGGFSKPLPDPLQRLQHGEGEPLRPRLAAEPPLKVPLAKAWTICALKVLSTEPCV